MTLEEQILNLVQQDTITDQKTLMHKLESLGYEVEQSTLSRVLKRLGVRKHLGRYMVFSTAGSISVPPPVSLEPFHVVPSPPNLLIVKTTSGFANALASLIDLQHIPGIAGSLAGDDTIFLALKENASCQQITEQLLTQLKNP
jgi:transcriptional regulator of arginine metabolism